MHLNLHFQLNSSIPIKFCSSLLIQLYHFSEFDMKNTTSIWISVYDYTHISRFHFNYHYQFNWNSFLIIFRCHCTHLIFNSTNNFRFISTVRVIEMEPYGKRKVIYLLSNKLEYHYSDSRDGRGGIGTRTIHFWFQKVDFGIEMHEGGFH